MANCLRQRLVLASWAAALLLVAAPTWASEIVVYSQSPDHMAIFASQNDAGGFGAFATSYDNFTLGSATAINQVTWVGGYGNPSTPGTITGWTVDFYADKAGQPGVLIASSSILGNGGETSMGTDLDGHPIFGYTAAVSFNAAPGTEYWMSVVPDLVFPPQWGWTSSSTGDRISYTDFFGVRQPNCIPLNPPPGCAPTDLAFALYMQQTIPEPRSLMLLGTGIMGIAGMLRRKRGA